MNNLFKTIIISIGLLAVLLVVEQKAYALPTITISSPASGLTNDNAPLLTYTVSDGTVVVKVDAVIVNKVSGDRLDSLSEGQHTVRVEATDSTGNMNFAEVNFTVDVTGPNVSAVASKIAASRNGSHNLEVMSDGTLWAWGLNNNGQLGDGTSTSRLSPVQIGKSSKWISVAAGYSHSLAQKSDGTLWAWGYNGYGQLGDGTSTNRFSPVQVGTDNKWVSVAAGEFHSLALKSDGTLWAWGDNGYGQLGDGTNTFRLSPVQVGTDNKWVSIAAGVVNSLALKSDGTLWAWGYNHDGEIGDGTSQNNRLAPVQVGIGYSWVAVAAGGFHSIAKKTDGTLWTWGWNGWGQLGDGTYNTRLSPVQIGVATNWSTVAAGFNHTLALKSDGTLWSWGTNDNGQIGDNTTQTRLTPTQIGNDTSWLTVIAGNAYSIATKTDSTVWAWGLNGSGQFGDGTTTSRLFPVKVASPSGFVINAGAARTNYTAVVLSYTATDMSGVAEMQFSNDGITWSASEPYSTPKNLTLTDGDGLNTVYARFKDNAGNWSTFSGTITLDTVTPPPVVTITSPLALTNSKTPLLTYTASEGTVTVKVDGVIVSKVSGNSLDSLADGAHVLHVESVSAAGLLGFAEATFTVDTTPPTITISSPPVTSNNQSPQLTYNVSDGAVTVKVDGVVAAKNTGDNLDILAEGSHIVRVESVDAAGNLGFAEKSFYVDLTPPTTAAVQIISAVANYSFALNSNGPCSAGV